MVIRLIYLLACQTFRWLALLARSDAAVFQAIGVHVLPAFRHCPGHPG
ncbi:hypothetical protein ABZW18_06300 [Streptomyces sp. NPDC004647]